MSWTGKGVMAAGAFLAACALSTATIEEIAPSKGSDGPTARNRQHARVFVIGVATPANRAGRADMILMCAAGDSAQSAADILQHLGYDRVHVLPGAAAAPIRRNAPADDAGMPWSPRGCVSWQPFGVA